MYEYARDILIKLIILLMLDIVMKLIILRY